MQEIIKCSICNVAKEDVCKFYLNSQLGKNLCNKHYLQIKNNGKVTDESQPNLEDNRIYWTKEEVDLLKELVNKSLPLKEIANILNKSRNAVSHKAIGLKIDTSQLYKNNVNFKAIYHDYDWCYQKYMIEGLSHDEMAKEAQCTKRVIVKWCVEKHRLTTEYRMKNKKLNNQQIDLIIASLLGDGHINKRETQPLFIVSHAENQKDYLYYKYEILKDLCNFQPTVLKNVTRFMNNVEYNCQNTYRMSTRIHHAFIPYRNMDISKLLQKLNEFSLSIWILDDGNRGESNWILCFARFSQTEKDVAINILKERFKLNCYLKKDVRYLCFDADSSRRLDKIIKSNIPNELDIMKCKIINNSNIAEERKRLYIKIGEQHVFLSEYCKDNKLNYKGILNRVYRGMDLQESLNIERKQGGIDEI